MSTPEKIGILLVILFVLVVGVLAFQLIQTESDKEPSELDFTEIDENGEDVKEVLDTTGGLETASTDREVIMPDSERSARREKLEGTSFGMIFGRVVEESGKPVEGAVIGALKAGSSILPHLQAQERLDVADVTDDRGHYELVGVEWTGRVIITAFHDDYAETSAKPVKIERGIRLEMPDIVMGHGTLVRGTVKDQFGNPISGAKAEIADPIRLTFQDEEERKSWKQVLTNDAGIYRFDNVAFKTFEVTVSAEGYTTQRKQNNVHFDNKQERVIDFSLTPGTFISGTCQDGQNMPLEGVKVEATQVQNKDFISMGVAFSQADGSFFIENLAEGKYVVRAAKEGYSEDVKQHIPGGRSDLNLVLKTRGGVSGTVRDWKTQEPIRKFKITTMMSRGGTRPPKRQKINESFNDKEGFYSITDLDPGTYTFQVSADGYANTTSDEVTVVRDYTINNVDIYMNRGGEISGSLVNKSGQPLKNVKVTLNENNFQDNPFYQVFAALGGPKGREKKKNTFTNGQGKFQMDLIVPGTYQVAFEHEDYTGKAINDVEVLMGQNTALGQIMLTEGAKVYGTVYTAARKPIPGATVVITQSSAFMRQATTNKDGVYVFGHLQPGEYDITIQVDRVMGKSFGDIFNMLRIARDSKITVYVEEGREEKADIHLVE